MQMLERACEQAESEEDQLTARLEAEREERFVLLHNIRALENEKSKRITANREYFGATEVVAADYGAGDVVSAKFRVAKVAAAEEAGKGARQRRGRTDSSPRADMVAAYFVAAEVESSEGADVVYSEFWEAEVAAAEKGWERERGQRGRTDPASMDPMGAADFEVAEVAHSERAEEVAADLWAAEAVAFDFEAVDVVAAYFGVVEVFAAEEAEKHAREISEMAVFGSRFAPQLWEDVDLEFDVFDERYAVHC